MKTTRINQRWWLPVVFGLWISFSALSVSAQMHVGTNLDGVVDWGASKFVDRLKMQRTWTTRNADGSGGWSSDLSELIPLDTQGWPTHIPFDPGNGDPMQIVHTVFPIRGAGTYKLIVEGTGLVRFVASNGMIDPTSPYNRGITFDLTGGVQEFDLVIHDSEYGDPIGPGYIEYYVSDVNDPVRNMKLIRPGHEANYEALPFDPTYTDGLAPFSNLRFMDWAETNHNPSQTWADRTTPDSYTQTRDQGVSIETMCEFSNQMNQDAWFCVPAEVDDDYVRNMAALIRQELNPDLKVFVEYSNETWNYIFSQTHYVAAQGLAQGLHTDGWQAAQMFVAKRSAEIWSIFEEEFGEDAPNRLVKVMASQASNVFLSNLRMQHLQSETLNPTGIKADVIAVAPYFGGSVANDIVDEGLVDSITVEEILDRTSDSLQTSVPAWMTAHEELANQFGVWLITYESGQHLVGDYNNDTLTEKLVAANRHPEMYNLYRTYLDMLNSHNVVLNSNFSYVTYPSRYGSWGIQENQDQSLAEAHKYRAIVDWIGDNPAANVAPVSRPGQDRRLVDADGNGYESVVLDGSCSRDFDGQIVSYQWIRNGFQLGDLATQELVLPIGDHAIDLTVTDNSGTTSTQTIVVTIAPATSAQVLVESDFSGTAPAQNTPWTHTLQLDPNAAFGGWTLGAGVNANDWDNVFGCYCLVGPEPRPLAEAVANDEYLSFSVTPAAGYELDLRGAVLGITIDRVDYHSPRQFTLMSSVDGFSLGNELNTTALTYNTGLNAFEFQLPSGESYRSDQPVEFRVYLSGGQYGFHDMSVNSFQLNGAAVVPNPSVLPQFMTLNRGVQSGGDISELGTSDNVDLSVQRSVADLQGIVELELKSVSPIIDPASLSFELEASVFARSTVDQTVWLWNYTTGGFEEVDSRPATRFADSTTVLTLTGDLTRFIEPGSRCIEARIRYQTVARRQRFSANLDRVVWTIE